MKQKVKVLVAFLLVAILALSVFGCNTGVKQTGVIGADEEVVVEGKIKLNYYLAETEGEKRSVREWVASFQKAYPDVEVQIETTYLAGTSRLDAQISSGTVGDVFFLPEVSLYNYAAQQQVLMPLNYYVEEYKIDTNNVFGAILEMGTVNGKMYMAMRDYNHIVMIYNKTLIKESNLQDPIELDEAGEWDWDTFKDYCAQLTKDTNGDQINDQIGALMRFGYAPVYIPFLEGFKEGGASWYNTKDKKITFLGDEDDPYSSPVLDGIGEMISFMQTGTVKLNPATSSAGIELMDVTAPEYAHNQFTDQSLNIGFRDIQYPLLNSLARAYDNENIEWDLVSFPALPEHKVGTGATGFVVFNGTKNPHAAAALCLSLYTEEGQTAYHSQEGGSVPNVRTLADDNFWQINAVDTKHLDAEGNQTKYFKAFVSHPEADTYGQPRCVLPPDIADIVDKYMTNLVANHLNNTMTWQDTVATLQNEANSMWEKIMKSEK